MSEIKVLIVEDEPAIGKFIERTLEGHKYQITSLAFDYEEGVNELETNKPDLVLLDINLNGDKDGIQLAELINQTYQIPFLFITSYSNTQTVERAKLTRPMGYIVKPFTEEDLLTTLEVALYNYSQRFHIIDLTLENLNAKLFEPITEREYAILKGIYNGQNNQQLATSNFISVNTVKTHIRKLYSKVDVSSRWELLIKLRELY